MGSAHVSGTNVTAIPIAIGMHYMGGNLIRHHPQLHLIRFFRFGRDQKRTPVNNRELNADSGQPWILICFSMVVVWFPLGTWLVSHALRRTAMPMYK